MDKHLEDIARNTSAEYYAENPETNKADRKEDYGDDDTVDDCDMQEVHSPGTSPAVMADANRTPDRGSRQEAMHEQKVDDSRSIDIPAGGTGEARFNGREGYELLVERIFVGIAAGTTLKVFAGDPIPENELDRPILNTGVGYVPALLIPEGMDLVVTGTNAGVVNGVVHFQGRQRKTKQ